MPVKSSQEFGEWSVSERVKGFWGCCHNVLFILGTYIYLLYIKVYYYALIEISSSRNHIKYIYKRWSTGQMHVSDSSCAFIVLKKLHLHCFHLVFLQHLNEISIITFNKNVLYWYMVLVLNHFMHIDDGTLRSNVEGWSACDQSGLGITPTAPQPPPCYVEFSYKSHKIYRGAVETACDPEWHPEWSRHWHHYFSSKSFDKKTLRSLLQTEKSKGIASPQLPEQSSLHFYHIYFSVHHLNIIGTEWCLRI